MILGPSKESFVPHTHERKGEWIYILHGRGTADIDDEEVPVATGDFLGFTTTSVVHHLRNTSDADLVYLMGGESRYAEPSSFPTLHKRKVPVGSRVDVIDIDQEEKEPR